jgi:hypothetical protein
VVPCGIEDGGVSSLQREGAAGLSPRGLTEAMAGELAVALDRRCEPADAPLRALCAAVMAGPEAAALA